MTSVIVPADGMEHASAPETIWSSDTRIEWIEEAFSHRRWRAGRWRFGPMRIIGTWWVDHAAIPDGLYGLGDTPEAACDDLVATVHAWRDLVVGEEKPR
jgi:hypothetical protein